MHGAELNRRTVESLIKAGAFDNLGSNRRSLVEATEGVLKSIESDSRKNLDGQIDLFSMMSGTDNTSAADSYEIKPCPEYTHAELLQQEKEVSGLYLSGHPLDAYREQSAQFATHTIKALTGEDANVPDNSHVRIVCTIVKSKMVTTKTNSMMAYTSVEDLTGTMEVIVFPRTLETFRDVLHDNAVVVIEGRLSIREDEPARLVAESISPIEGYNPVRPQANRPNQMRDAARRLYVRLPSRTSPEYAKVVNLLEIFDGDIAGDLLSGGHKTEAGGSTQGCIRQVIRFSLRNCSASWAKRMLQQNDMRRNDSNLVQVCQKRHQDARL